MTTNIYQPVAEDILTILRRKAEATDDVYLRLHLEAAMWEAAAMNERHKHEMESEINATPQRRGRVDTSTPRRSDR